MRLLVFCLFSILIVFLTKSVWLELNPWYYKVIFLSIVVLIPFILYSFAAKIAFKTGWLCGLLTMIIITIIDNYLTNAFSLCIISKSIKGFYDLSGFKLSFELLKLPWYTYAVSGAMGLITGILGDRQRQIEKERQQRAVWLGVYLIAGQFLGMAVPELAPIITRVTPVVTTVLATEIASKTGGLAAAESTKISNKNVTSLTASGNEISENALKAKYFKYSFLRNGKPAIANIPDFTPYSVFETKLPSNLFIASDEVQFAMCKNLLREQYIKNPNEITNKIDAMNRVMLKRDRLIFVENKIDILKAQSKMLEATKNNDLVTQRQYLKELRRLTNKITFIETPIGKPFVMLDANKILIKQIAEIRDSSNGRLFGFIWHHCEEPGIMQLVAKDAHEYNRHIGGNFIWGGNVR